jgi:DHA1 family multidrug resistance protein-like MFS transporter
LASISVSIAYAFVGPSFSAFIAEQSTEETRGRVYGITSTLFMVVNIVGPVVGGLIAQGLSFKVLFIVAGMLYASAALIRVLMARFAGRKQATPEYGEPAPKSGFSQFKSSLVSIIAMMTAGGLLTWIFISDGVRDVAFGLTDQLMPVYLENEMSLTLLQIGSLQSITAIAAMIFMSPAGWLSDKAGERVGIVGGFGLIAVGWAVFLYGSTFAHFIASRLIIGVGWALIDPAYNSLISKAVPEKQRGLAFGFFASSISLIALPAPWVGAQLWEAFTPRFPFFIPLIALVVMLPVMWIKFKLPTDSASGDPEVLPGTLTTPVPETGK